MKPLFKKMFLATPKEKQEAMKEVITFHEAKSIMPLPFSDHKPIPHNRVYSPAVMEIHKTFDEAMAELLKANGILNPIIDPNIALEEKVEKLKSLGFTRSKEVQDLEEQIENNKRLALDNIERKAIVADLNYFKHKYPYYKFITLHTLNQICEKYKLSWGAVQFYEGDIPDDNLQDMMGFRIDEKDKAYIQYLTGGTRYVSSEEDKKEIRERNSLKNFRLLDVHQIYNPEGKILDEALFIQRVENKYNSEGYMKAPMIIAAPKKFFPSLASIKYNDFGEEIETFGKIQADPDPKDEDPIVMQPVWRWQGRIYMAIATAWGPEASDPELLNERNN